MNRRDVLKSLPAWGAASLVTSPASLAASEQPAAASRLHPGIVAYSFRKKLADRSMTYDDLIHLAAAAGLDGIDTTAYWFPDNSPAFLAKLRTTAYRNAIQLYSLAVRIRICQPTPELRAAEIASCQQWVDAAERIGAGHVRVFAGTVPKGAAEQQAIAWAVESLKRASDYAATRGIILGLEDDGGLTTHAEQTVEIVKQTGSPFAGINLDTGNFPKNGYDQVALCLPYATSVHFKTLISDADGHKQKADWPRLAQMFRASGYRGFLSLEYEEADDPSIAIPPLLPELKRICA